jgi:hypothetical protein
MLEIPCSISMFSPHRTLTLKTTVLEKSVFEHLLPTKLQSVSAAMVSLRSVAVLLLGMVALHVHAASAQPTTDAGDATIPPLPPIQRLPEGCGAVAQVVSGYTSCQDFS